ncbi:hypothetical protein Aca07nite_44940 [Actinoplanes capillaceus]|uniref:Nudix hydrolase domain-containing protein n=1 Tax=Actinoplanes campanulatus TaxID=113559 RepID=A0ABQ3WLX5_9ACTN|nr:hypothetical protein Aca07nite_44940 [Actinoplanes capillaceus]
MKPAYKHGWDIPGGYVEPGESPRAACNREVREELGIAVNAGSLLVVDWAPADEEGDKMLFVFDAGELDTRTREEIRFSDGELTESRFVARDNLAEFVPARLFRRLSTAIDAKHLSKTAYAEHGVLPGPSPQGNY